MRRFVTAAITLPILGAVIFGSPIMPGVQFLFDTPSPAGVETSASDYTPLHKGSIDPATGLYIRVNEDLVVQGTPALVLRRTYLSGFREPREFGLGATHAGEEYLIGDGEQFQWASLILASGTRINFKRVSPGTSLLTARYVHEESAGEWNGAQLAWAAFCWALKKRDGSVLLFSGCGKGTVCSIIQSTDARGHTIYYRRDWNGRLKKMESGNRWIALDYDDGGRIAHAYDSAEREVTYEYDRRGRLERVTGSDGFVRRYTYTDLDELETIVEPGTSITNKYADGRCVRQVNWYPDRDPDIVVVSYDADGKAVYRTRISESDGTWREYAWDDRQSSVSERIGRSVRETAFIMYDRDEVSRAVTGMTVSCRDRDGRAVRRSTPVSAGEEDALKRLLLQKYCS